MDKFKIYDLDCNTAILYKKCFDDNGSPKNKENIEWQFFQNPIKKSFVDIAYDTMVNKTAAIYAISCVPFLINNKVNQGSQSLDTITDKDYRGKGLFTQLAASVYQKAKDGNIALVYGFPNGNSIHGFSKKLDWVVLDPVPFLIKPLKSGYFTNKIKFLKWLPNLNLSFRRFITRKEFVIKAEKSFPLGVNKIWDIFSSDIKVSLNRDKEYLDWRYIKKPNEDYKIAHCYDLSNEYLGFIVYTVKDKHDGKIAYVMELLYDLSKPEIGDYLMKYAVNAIKKEGADCILGWCFSHSPNYKIYKKNFFIYMPEKIRPIELHFGAKAFNPELKPIIDERSNWFISYSDSDTV